MNKQRETELSVALDMATGAPNDYPSDDTSDQCKGARWIPCAVTLARRAKQPVNFVQNCGNPCCWYWEFHDVSKQPRKCRTWPTNDTYYGMARLDGGYDEFGYERVVGYNYVKPGQRIYHFERCAFETLRDQHDGKCPSCGNTNITGATAEGVLLEGKT